MKNTLSSFSFSVLYFLPPPLFLPDLSLSPFLGKYNESCPWASCRLHTWWLYRNFTLICMGLRGGSFYESRILFWLRCSGNSNPGTERDGTQMLSSIVACVSLHSHYTDVCLSQSERERGREGEMERRREAWIENISLAVIKVFMYKSYSVVCSHKQQKIADGMRDNRRDNHITTHPFKQGLYFNYIFQSILTRSLPSPDHLREDMPSVWGPDEWSQGQSRRAAETAQQLHQPEGQSSSREW